MAGVIADRIRKGRTSSLDVAYTPAVRPGTPAVSQSEIEAVQEKVRIAAATGQIRIMPRLDLFTDETEAMRAAYPKMLRIPAVKAAMLGKLYSVASLDPQVTPVSDEPRDKEISDFVLYAYTKALGFPESTPQYDITPAGGGVLKIAEAILLHGWIDKASISEKVWCQNLWNRGKWSGKRFYRDLKPKERCELVQDDYGNVVGVRRNYAPAGGAAAGGTGGGDVISPRDFVIYRHLCLFEGAGMADLRAAYGFYLRLDALQQIWYVHLDRYVSPALKASYTDADSVPKLETELAKLKSRGYILYPEGVVVEALQLAQRGEAEMEAACRYYEEKIALSISGAFLQMLTAKAGSGDMRGDAGQQASTADRFVWHAKTVLEHAINAQLTPTLVDENYLGADYPTLSLGGVNYADMLQSIQLEQIAQQMGAKLGRKAFYTKYSLQEATSDADALLPTPPGGMPLPGMPGGPPGVFPRANQFQFADPLAVSDPSKVRQQHARETASAGRDVGLGGSDGDRVEQLMATAQFEGTSVLVQIVGDAVARALVEHPGGELPEEIFTEDERAILAEQIRNTNGVAELLGRSRIRLRQQRAEQLQGASHFSSEPTGFYQFDAGGPLQPVPPEEAINYFRSLVPTLGVRSAGELATVDFATAFAIAGATERVVVDKVKQVILDRLTTGRGISSAPEAIADILTDAGISFKNPQYPEAVFRTGMMTAYNEGAQREFDDPDVRDTFPAWMYANPADIRSRKHHAAKDGKYFPAERKFADVRGTEAADVINCRCTPIPVDKWEWESLQRAGTTFYTFADRYGIRSAMNFAERAVSLVHQLAGDFDESKHNRDGDGKFAPKGGGGGKVSKQSKVDRRQKIEETRKLRPAALRPKSQGEEILDRAWGDAKLGFKPSDPETSALILQTQQFVGRAALSPMVKRKFSDPNYEFSPKDFDTMKSLLTGGIESAGKLIAKVKADKGGDQTARQVNYTNARQIEKRLRETLAKFEQSHAVSQQRRQNRTEYGFAAPSVFADFDESKHNRDGDGKFAPKGGGGGGGSSKDSPKPKVEAAPAAAFIAKTSEHTVKVENNLRIYLKQMKSGEISASTASAVADSAIEHLKKANSSALVDEFRAMRAYFESNYPDSPKLMGVLRYQQANLRTYRDNLAEEAAKVSAAFKSGDVRALNAAISTLRKEQSVTMDRLSRNWREAARDIQP